MTSDAKIVPATFIPQSMEEAVDPRWLTMALAPVSGGSEVVSVELAEVIKTLASKVRIRVRFANDPDAVHSYCLKAFWGVPGAGGLTTIREGKFYSDIAPQISMRLPKVPALVLDEDKGDGILIMEDLIAAGARFCSALEPFTPDLAVESLDQLARLHSRTDIADSTSWLPDRLERIAANPHFTVERMQEVLDDGRTEILDDRTSDARLVLQALRALAERTRARPRTLLHGDCHAGNLFTMADGLGFTDWQLVQRGHWACDVAYHICAVLTVGQAEQHEEALLKTYLAALVEHGGSAPGWDEAWEEYRAAQIYGYYHWGAITTRGAPDVMRIFTERLGAGVARHRCFDLLGI
ncbi:MAG: phosphotransferase [Sphingobium sp.]